MGGFYPYTRLSLPRGVWLLLVGVSLAALCGAGAPVRSAAAAPLAQVPEPAQIFLPQVAAGAAQAEDVAAEDAAAAEPLEQPPSAGEGAAIFLPLVQIETGEVAGAALADPIFAAGFETGNLSVWTASVTDGGDLAATEPAQRVGTYGMRALIDDNNPIYVEDGRPAAEAGYRARFSFDPNSIAMGNGNAHYIFRGYSATWAILWLALRYYNGNYQIRVELLDDNANWRNSTWFTISDAPHFLEISWKAATRIGANNGYLTLWIDNVQRAKLAYMNNDTLRIERVQMGAVAGIDSGTRGAYFFDAFESRRYTYIGPTSDPILVAAGDIADCATAGAIQTAALLDGIAGTVVTLGDNAYAGGSLSSFNSCYKPTWGRHLARTRPSVGNHEYLTGGAAGYFTYFGAVASPRDIDCKSNCRGYYSYDLGAWHIIVLNSEIPMSAGSVQEQWLRSDLATHPALCTLAYWHTPRFSSGANGNSLVPAAVWRALYEQGVDVVLNGHEHFYERFAPQNPDGAADPQRGIRQFVVGTGGAGLTGFGTVRPSSVVRNSNTWGVLTLALQATSYTWQFVPVAGKTFTDTGSANCVSAP
jgi:hypothetical protein